MTNCKAGYDFINANYPQELQQQQEKKQPAQKEYDIVIALSLLVDETLSQVMT